MHSFFRWIQRGRKSGRTASWQYQNTFCGAKYCLKKGEKPAASRQETVRKMGRRVREGTVFFVFLFEKNCGKIKRTAGREAYHGCAGSAEKGPGGGTHPGGGRTEDLVHRAAGHRRRRQNGACPLRGGGHGVHGGAGTALRRVPRLPEGAGGHPPRCHHRPGPGAQEHRRGCGARHPV